MPPSQCEVGEAKAVQRGRVLSSVHGGAGRQTRPGGGEDDPEPDGDGLQPPQPQPAGEVQRGQGALQDPAGCGHKNHRGVLPEKINSVILCDGQPAQYTAAATAY